MIASFSLARAALVAGALVLVNSAAFACEPPCFGFGGGFKAGANAYTGEAQGIYITGVVNPPGLNPIAVGDTGELATSGGVKSSVKANYLIANGALSSTAVGCLATGAGDESSSATAITNFHGEFITDEGVHIVIEADYIGAIATCTGVNGKASAKATTVVRGLKINGTPYAVTGAANQLITVGQSRLWINEQTTSASGASADATVTAIHFDTCQCIEGWLAKVSAGITVGAQQQQQGGGNTGWGCRG